MDRWENKVAVITGASGSIGSAIAKELVKSGMVVCCLARKKDKINALKASLFGERGIVAPVECDITNEYSLKQAYAFIEKEYGGVDLLVNNAGIITDCLLTDPDNTRDLRVATETNIVGLCMCIREAIKMMKKTGTGHIININSIFGHNIHQCVPGTRPINGMFPASKFAVTAITECIRQELIYLSTHIKVSSISPGLVEDDIVDNATKTDNEFIKYMPKLKPDDVAQAIIFCITQPEHVQVHEIILKPMGEFV